MTAPTPADRAIEALREVREYLDNRADCDIEDGRLRPNAEARLLVLVDGALACLGEHEPD